jgi:CBS domain containing-hemolysin-like protein
MSSDSLGLTYVLVSIFGAALFNGAEMGLLSVNRLRLRQATERGSRGAILLQRLLDRQEAFLTTTLIATNLFTISGAAVATSLLEPRMGHTGAILATVIMTSAHVVLSEIVPKAVFRQLADHLMPILAPVLRLAVLIFSPLVAALMSAYRVFLRSPRSLFVTREELYLMVKEASRETGSRFRERKMLESVFDFSETVAREVMIPLSDVITIDEEAPREALLDLVRHHGHTRIPVYGHRPDRIHGFVNVFDLLYDREPKPTVRDYRRDIPIFPDSKRIDRLLRDLQAQRTSMATVVNEFGTIVGIVTVEDIIEEIMGELVDEHEEPAPKIRQVAPFAYLVDARTDIDDLNQELGFDLPKERYDTVGGLLLRRFGRIPRPGEVTRFRGLHFRVEEAHDYGISWVRLSLEGFESPGAEKKKGELERGS